MNKKNLLLAALAVLLVLLLAGAYLLYQSLAAQVEPEQSIVVEEEPEKVTMSGISDRPYCKGRAYDPNRYSTTEE